MKLWVEDGQLAYECTCPVGADGLFCKHYVAAGLAWLDGLASRSEAETTAARAAAPKPRAVIHVTMSDVKKYLAQLGEERLVEMLLERAEEDDEYAEKLVLETVSSRPGVFDLAPFRSAITRATSTNDVRGYRDIRRYARRVATAADIIVRLVKEGRGAEAVELAEHAISRVEKALHCVDDSDGDVGAVLSELQELHLAACRAAKPDPLELARRLFEWELSSGWEVFHGAAETYADVLGEKGLAVYRQLAEAEWKKQPALGPGQDRISDSRRFAITSIMETLARQSGDLDELIAVKAKDLFCAYNFLQIAELCSKAGRNDQALEWAEKGVKAFPDKTDSRLREFLANEYHRRDRHCEAMNLIWAEFTDDPQLEAYKVLKAHADRTGQWSAWREEALEYLRDRLARERKEYAGKRKTWIAPVDSSALVEILLRENEADAAWSEAQSGGCHRGLWLKLAALRERAHPEDAIPVYRRAAEQEAHQASYSHACGRVVELLRKTGALMARIGKREEFRHYLETFRAENRPKRNLMKLLDSTRWP